MVLLRLTVSPPLGWFAIEGVDYTKIGENISAAKYFNILG